jgi:exo-beta-1,3-glucanase (GH17 family)
MDISRFNPVLMVTVLTLLTSFNLPGCKRPDVIHAGKDKRSQLIDSFGITWPFNSICYSGYRKGQSPQKEIFPSRKEVTEDLRILERNFKLIRVYGSDRHAADVLQSIRDNNIDIKVILGAYLMREKPGDISIKVLNKNREFNKKQIENCIRLAGTFDDIVVAVNVGNEALVSWSFVPVPVEKVIQYVKQVKNAVAVHVTVADNFAFWLDRERSEKLVKELDFIMAHIYPLWEKMEIDQGYSETLRITRDIQEMYPDKAVILGECGWSTFTSDPQTIKRTGSEANQKRYFEELTPWVHENKIITLFFEAFDEPWKGTGTTEGHWGFFTVTRKAKPVMLKWYPELKSHEATSPEYH